MQWAERRYPWQPWKREPSQERPLTGTVTLNEIQWRYLPKRILTWENTYETTKQGGRRGRKNPQWFARRQKLIRYDQQAKLQCNATLAKEHTRSPAIPRGLPRRSRTGVGEDRWPTCSSLNLLKWFCPREKNSCLTGNRTLRICDDRVQCSIHWTILESKLSWVRYIPIPLVKMTWIECVLLSVYISCVCLPAVWLTSVHLLSTIIVKIVGRLLLFSFFPLFFPPPDPLLEELLNCLCCNCNWMGEREIFSKMKKCFWTLKWTAFNLYNFPN